MRILFIISMVITLLMACSTDEMPLSGFLIVVDAGHGGTADTDTFRVGAAGEREEWINLRVALELQEILESRGATVLMTRTEDVHIDLADRAELAVSENADLFLSVHHNATADPYVNFPIVYFHGNRSENRAGVRLAELMALEIKNSLFDEETPAVIASDHTIFPNSGTGVLRHSYGVPGVITEASFFTNPDEEQRLKDPEYIRLEAEALARAVERFFSKETLPVEKPYTLIQLPPFEVFQEADRMSPEAMRWREYFIRATELAGKDDHQLLEEAYEYATRTVRSFPDSPVAREAHLLRADLLDRMDRPEEAETERTRANELYLPVQ